MRVRIHVDRVVLHGAAPFDPPRFRAAFESEFARLVAFRGLPARAGASWQAGVLTAPAIGAAASPEDAGRQLAHRFYGALS